jgi:hypothetical protein
MMFEGDGDPEGHVAALFGNLFLRVNADTSTALYLKSLGTGTTGWVQMAQTNPSYRLAHRRKREPDVRRAHRDTFFGDC